MKNSLTLFKLYMVLVIMLFAQRGFSQVPNLNGTWVLNLSKSKLEQQPEGFTGSTFIIAQKGDQLTLTRIHYFGEKSNKIRFKMKVDGRTRRIKILFKGKLEKEEKSLLATLWRKGFSNVVRYHYGENENELVADEVMKSKANNHHNVWVFDKKQ